jgi:hypothetical protein
LKEVFDEAITQVLKIKKNPVVRNYGSEKQDKNAKSKEGKKKSNSSCQLI